MQIQSLLYTVDKIIVIHEINTRLTSIDNFMTTPSTKTHFALFKNIVKYNIISFFKTIFSKIILWNTTHIL